MMLYTISLLAMTMDQASVSATASVRRSQRLTQEERAPPAECSNFSSNQTCYSKETALLTLDMMNNCKNNSFDCKVEKQDACLMACSGLEAVGCCEYHEAGVNTTEACLFYPHNNVQSTTNTSTSVHMSLCTHVTTSNDNDKIERLLQDPATVECSDFANRTCASMDVPLLTLNLTNEYVHNTLMDCKEENPFACLAPCAKLGKMWCCEHYTGGGGYDSYQQCWATIRKANRSARNAKRAKGSPLFDPLGPSNDGLSGTPTQSPSPRPTSSPNNSGEMTLAVMIAALLILA